MALKSSEARAQKRNKTKSVIIFKNRGHTGVIQLYVYILCVFLLTMPVKFNTIYFDMLPMAIAIYINYRYWFWSHVNAYELLYVYIFAAIAYVFLVFFEVLN